MNLLTTKDLGNYFNRSSRTILRWRRRGIIPPPDRIIVGSPFWQKETVEAVGKISASELKTEYAAEDLQ